MDQLKIQGDRQVGKSTLLSHYIKDALAMGLKVLLTGESLDACKDLEHRHGFKATRTTTSKVIGSAEENRYNVLAIENCKDVKVHIDKYGPALAEGCVIVYVME